MKYFRSFTHFIFNSYELNITKNCTFLFYRKPTLLFTPERVADCVLFYLC